MHKFNIEKGHLFLFGMPRGYYELEPLPRNGDLTALLLSSHMS